MTTSPDREVAEEPLHILLVRLRNEFSVKEEATLVLRTIEQSSHGFGGTQKKTEAVGRRGYIQYYNVLDRTRSFGRYHVRRG